MAHVLKGSHSFTCTPRVHPLTEWTIPIAFPAEAGTHLPTPEGWKAELAWGGWLVTYWNNCPAPGIEPDTVAHLSTNGVRRRLTSLIEANALTTTPDHHSALWNLYLVAWILAAGWVPFCHTRFCSAHETSPAVAEGERCSARSFRKGSISPQRSPDYTSSHVHGWVWWRFVAWISC